jgi:hypothetical protein
VAIIFQKKILELFVDVVILMNFSGLMNLGILKRWF